MNDWLSGFLGALLATNTPVAVSNLVHQKTGLAVPVAAADPNDPVEQAYQKVLAEDDAALSEINAWRDGAAKGGLQPSDVEASLLNNRIRQRAASVRKAYDAFLERNPKHTNARVAYAAFLDELGEEEAAEQQLEKAVELDPSSPAALNNLANHYGHNGQVRKAFPLYERAVQLSPREPLYCENLATTVFLFRQDAIAHYGITEQEVFAKALALYRKALELDPGNFDRAVELAKTYYGVRLPTTGDPAARREAERKLGEEAMAAWKTAHGLASSDEEREGVRLHFARWHINAGRFDEALSDLQSVTNAQFAAGKATLLKKLESRRKPAGDTGAAAPADAGSDPGVRPVTPPSSSPGAAPAPASGTAPKPKPTP